MCRCVPWNYPHQEEEDTICDSFGVYCFEDVIAHLNLTDKCDCRQECNILRYSNSISSTKLDPEEFCNRRSDYFDHFGNVEYSPPPNFMRGYESVVNNISTGEYELCVATVGKIATVNLQMASQTFTTIKRTRRVSTADMISSFGRLLDDFVNKVLFYPSLRSSCGKVIGIELVHIFHGGGTTIPVSNVYRSVR